MQAAWHELESIGQNFSAYFDLFEICIQLHTYDNQDSFVESQYSLRYRYV